MIRLSHLIEQATARVARSDYQRGYGHGANDLNPPNPDDLSEDYWRGYADGQRDRYWTEPGRPGGAHDGLSDC